MVQAFGYLAFVILVTAYAAPSVIAILRAHRRWPLVVAIDVLFGWTVVGWIVALAMAFDLRLPKPRRPKARPKLASVGKPPETSGAPPSNPAPVREHVEPPPVQEEAYARWLDGGEAMGA